MTVTILSVHGNGGSGTRFERVAEHLRDDSTHFVHFDLPGFNGTPIDPQATDVAAYADKVATSDSRPDSRRTRSVANTRGPASGTRPRPAQVTLTDPPRPDTDDRGHPIDVDSSVSVGHRKRDPGELHRGGR
jgi:pimeloyl-ACP methyl ester carboxylesterase